jgi:transposase InsO family protein
LCIHLKNSREKWAVLGQFQASESCAERALSLWVNTSSFFFPQQSLKAGQVCGASYFVTCNLSLRREAILAVGNFDPAFRVAEDTELGARMEKAGYRVFYHPTAHATHEHPQFTTSDLLRRAAQYGVADWLLFQKHPQLLSSGESPFGRLSAHDFERIETTVAENAAGVAGATTALEALDRVNLLPFFEHAKGQESPAAEVLQRLSQIVPLVYWHELFKSLLAARDAAAKKSVESDLAAAGNRT